MLFAGLCAARAAAGGPALSPRTLVVAIEVDRDQAQLLAYTVKPRPFVAVPEPEPQAYASGERLQVEVVLHGPRGQRVLRRVDVGPVCLDHGPEAEPHVLGDTIWLHRESFLVELPELAGFDQVEMAWFGGDGHTAIRNAVGYALLDAERFDPAAGSIDYRDLAFASSRAAGPPARTASGEVRWPEEYGDTERYRVYGSEAETDRRINVVLVPDGYTYAQKATLIQHADQLVAYFRGKTPYKEHDPFLNYVLVFAYSNGSGTDQCDCSIVVDTAMNTSFPRSVPTCGSSSNRCLYYGGGAGRDCDTTQSTANITAAELRAPARDTTVIMVNTSRYGGCGGARAVYSAANGSANEVAVHELGHSLAGLADEYGGNNSCGSGSGVNVSMDSTQGNWPEWIAQIGAPREGARYYDQCVYRPKASCDMRSLNQPFCEVCNQQWALRFFGHARVSPTAPITSQDPAPAQSVPAGGSIPFSVVTRLAVGANVTNRYTWTLQGPGFPVPTVVATTPAHTQQFDQAGTYTLTLELQADTNFIKPVKNGKNVDTVSWTIQAGCDAAPRFGGLREVTDPDACLLAGLDLAWDPAVFGSRGGSYTVRRDGVVVASGLGGTGYRDVPGDSLAHDYHVEAVTGDCTVSDGNNLTLAGTDLAFTGPLAALANVLMAVKEVDSVRLTWTDEPGADGYTVARSDARDFSAPAAFGTATTGATGVLDANALGQPETRHYRVRQERCGVTSGY